MTQGAGRPDPRRRRWTPRRPVGLRRRSAAARVVLATALSGCSRAPGPAGARRRGHVDAGRRPPRPPARRAAATATTPAAVNVYAARRRRRSSPGAALHGQAAGLRAQHPVATPLQVIDPATYQVVARYPHRPRAAARRAQLGPETPVGQRRPGQRPRPDQPAHRQARHAGRRRTTPTTSTSPPTAPTPWSWPSGCTGIDVRDPHTMALQRSLPVPCAGINHADFSADLSRLRRQLRVQRQAPGHRPRRPPTSARSSTSTPCRPPGATTPDEAMHMRGPADRAAPGRHARCRRTSGSPPTALVPGGRHAAQRRLGDQRRHPEGRPRSCRTGKGAHGIYPSRDAARLFVSNRDAGTITVLDAATLTDPRHVEAARRRLSRHGRRHRRRRTAVAVRPLRRARSTSSTPATGKLIARIPVDAARTGCCVWPQPGRF